MIVNAAAYTAVDKAESKAELAEAVNIEGPRNIATAANEVGARLIHISTDYVFPGDGTALWKPEDATGPLGVYGRTKLEGEDAIKRNRLVMGATNPVDADPGEVDDTHTEDTRRAVEERQEDEGLPVTGEIQVGSLVWVQPASTTRFNASASMEAWIRAWPSAEMAWLIRASMASRGASSCGR